jgi:carbamoyltransferase
MIILGLSCLQPSVINHDATAALLIDGKLISAVSEDRFTKVKHYYGYPAMAIKYCLEKEGLRLSDVDKVVVGYGLLKDQIEPSSIKQFSSQARPLSLFKDSHMREKNPIFYDHEYIHAKTGYFLSGFKDAVIISIDGGGNDNGQLVSGGIFIIKNGNTEVIKLYPQSSTLGWTYGAFTELCGFRMADGEGKTMSLAAFGEKSPKESQEKIYKQIREIFPRYRGINYLGGGIEWPSWYAEHNEGMVRFDDTRLIGLINSYSKELIAWGAQKVLEDILIELCTSAVEATGLKNVILTGGVFFNMIANMKIKEKLDKMGCSIFINPVCGDMGNAVGAVLEEYYQQTGKMVDNLSWSSISLGPEYDEKQILSAMERANLSYHKTDKISTTIDLIDKGKSVGWFQGRAELGPRGLGNRSILAKVDDMTYKDMINEKVKHRERWRPFCPTVIYERSDHYLENSTFAPYMILGFRMKHADEVPAVVHVDNTTRPQTLKRSYNEDFYDVVKGAGGIILNTSLNLAGDPINLTPEDAISSFKHSSMDALVIGDYLITR